MSGTRQRPGQARKRLRGIRGQGNSRGFRVSDIGVLRVAIEL